jgi:CHAP domain
MNSPKNTASLMLETAFVEVGYTETPDNLTKYGEWAKTNGVPWCGIFVKWVAAHAGAKVPNPTFTPAGAQAFQSLHAWHEKGDPQPGDIIFFDFPHDGIDRISHVGIVVKALVPGGDVLTIEGNTAPAAGNQRNGGCVAIKVRHRNEIVGWGRPVYTPAPITIDIAALVAAEKPKTPVIAKKAAAPKVVKK